MAESNNRKFNRVNFKTQGFIKLDGQEHPFDLMNISLKGILLETDEDFLKEGETYDLCVKLLSSDEEINASATFIHEKGSSKGFFFKEIDLESMIHLRRILELNGTNENEIGRELFFLKDYAPGK